MTITQKTTTYYSIDDHPEPERVYQWIRDNWHDLAEADLFEAVTTLKAFCEHFNLELVDYSISAFQDYRDNVTVRYNDDIKHLTGVRLWKYITNNFLDYHEYSAFSSARRDIQLLAGNCPFTGVCYDETMLDPIRAFMAKPDPLNDFECLMVDCFDALLNVIYAEAEYRYSDDGLRDMCEANEYQFNQDGEIL